MSPRQPPDVTRSTCSECGDFDDDEGGCGSCGNCGWPLCTHRDDDPDGICCPDTCCMVAGCDRPREIAGLCIGHHAELQPTKEL